jgi:mRNA-degrading endonuclease RelE of RelBE toxin-antitoxin system
MRDLKLKPPLKVDFSPVAQKQLDKMDAREEAKILEGAERFALTLRPSPKPLRGSLKGAYRLRFGDRRAIVRLYEDAVYVLEIGNRDKVYKQ